MCGMFSGGDDRRVLLWNVDKTLYRKEKPVAMKGQHRSNIFCTVFDGDNRHVYSAGKGLLNIYIHIC
jgi:WD repeat-containing protein 22